MPSDEAVKQVSELERLLAECEKGSPCAGLSEPCRRCARERKLVRIVRMLRDHLKACNTNMDNDALAEAEKIAGEDA